MEMTKKKWLMLGGGGIGVMFLLCCSCGILVTVVIYMPSWQSPGDSLRTTFMAGNAGKYADADNGFADDLQKAMKGMSKQLWDNQSKNGQIATVEIHKEGIRGDGAFVQYTITFKNGDRTGTRLIKGPVKGERLPGKRTANPDELVEGLWDNKPRPKPPSLTPDNDEEWIIRPLEAELIKQGGKWKILHFSTTFFAHDHLLKSNEKGKLVIK